MRRSGLPPFEEFLEEHRAMVYRFLIASAGPAEADDCFQETFLSALRAYPRVREGSNLRAWVLTIATRKVIDMARARGHRAVPVADPDLGAAREAEDPAGADPLWEAVRALPLKQRAAVAHRFVLDMTYADVAEAMGTSEETARANVYQGLKKLRERTGSEHAIHA
jgi:RNA polymerase sigma factor (sigma-70 family)